MDEGTAAVLERVVRDAIELAGGEKPSQATWPSGFFDHIREDW